MDNDNYVIFKGGRNGIVVLLNKDVSFDILKEQLRKKVCDAKKFFDKSKAPITFKGRELSDEEEKECIEIIASESNLNIMYVYNGTEDKKQLINQNTSSDMNITPTKFHYGALRSGQVIKFNGSVIVIGDVNPGGEIIADGNVIIIGTLKGKVHAGYSGRKDVFVVALKLSPVQLRIANIITYFPDDILKSKSKTPQYAHIENDKICVEPINYRLS